MTFSDDIIFFQGHGRAQVLGTMLECAASWIQGGLPLKCLKIVIYGRDHSSDLNDVFTRVKAKYMAMGVEQEVNLHVCC